MQKSKKLWLAIFRISSVWHVGWWNLITRVRLIEVGNNRNDHFVLFGCPRPLNRGVELIKVSFEEKKGNKFGDFGYCPLDRGCPLNTGFTVPAETMHGTLLTVRLETFWNLTNFRGTITSSFISSGVNLYRMKHSVPLLYKSYWMANNQNNSLIVKKRWGMAETTPLTSF